MDKVELTISIERERMDVLSFFLRDKDNSSVQKEMEQALQELYERCVPEEHGDTSTAAARRRRHFRVSRKRLLLKNQSRSAVWCCPLRRR